MSRTSRARKLSALTNLSYQHAVQHLNRLDLGPRDEKEYVTSLAGGALHRQTCICALQFFTLAANAALCPRCTKAAPSLDIADAPEQMVLDAAALPAKHLRETMEAAELPPKHLRETMEAADVPAKASRDTMDAADPARRLQHMADAANPARRLQEMLGKVNSARRLQEMMDAANPARRVQEVLGNVNSARRLQEMMDAADPEKPE